MRVDSESRGAVLPGIVGQRVLAGPSITVTTPSSTCRASDLDTTLPQVQVIKQLAMRRILELLDSALFLAHRRHPAPCCGPPALHGLSRAPAAPSPRSPKEMVPALKVLTNTLVVLAFSNWKNGLGSSERFDLKPGKFNIPPTDKHRTQEPAHL